MKKFTRLLAAILIASITAGCFAACTPERDKTELETLYYTVKFDLDGGEIAGNDLSQGLKVESGSELKLENYKPQKRDNEFIGWLSGEKEYAEKAVIKIVSDITLKAVWRAVAPEKYTVTFDLNGGIMNGSSENIETKVEKNFVIDFSDYFPERTDYIFKGWKCGENLYKEGTYTVTGETEFVALWLKTPSADENFVFAETAEGDGYILEKLADDMEITDIAVPGYYNAKPVVKIANDAFSYKHTITSVDLSNCEKLEEIGDGNFSNCEKLVSVNLEGCLALEKIGGRCFHSNVLTKINLKGLKSLEEIGVQCFRCEYEGSNHGTLPVEELDFSDCVSLEKIGKMSFWHLKVKELDFSNTKIKDFEIQTAMYCPALEKISLPATLNLTEACSETFGDCENLKEIVLSPENIYMTVEDGALMDADKTVIFKYEVNSEARTKYVAPATVKTVMSRAFYSADKLTEIDFTNTRLTKINNSAFAQCTNATLELPFGEDGTYEDESKSCVLGPKWNEGVNKTEYGNPAKIFAFSVEGLTDGESVTTESLTFTASATYGTSKNPEPCALTVKVNDEVISGDSGSYTATLKDGDNTIELIAAADGKTETKTYTVNKVEQASIQTDLKGPNAKGKVTFNVWVATGAGGRQDLSRTTLIITVAYGKGSNAFSDPPSSKPNWLTSSYDSEQKCFVVTVDFDDLYNYMFEDYHKLKIEITGTACEPYITEEFKYE